MFHHAFEPATATSWPTVFWGAFMLIAGAAIVLAITRTRKK
jgi:hypothetical protein